MRIFWFILLALFCKQVHSQEIEARLYSNAPIGINFVTGGIAQAKSGAYLLTTEAVNLTRIIDVFGQSGRMSISLPYAQISGSGSAASQSVNASVEGLSDPVVKVSANLYGAPALSLEEFKSYQQDLIIGASLAASIPWGKYNSEKMLNVGANRSLIEPGIGASQAVDQWRLELSGMATIFTSNTNYLGGNTLSQNPIYSTDGHFIYYFQNTSWISADAIYFMGGQKFINGIALNGSQENWRFGSTFSYPINKHNSIRLTGSKGVYSSSNTSYNALGLSWQYRWGGGL